MIGIVTLLLWTLSFATKVVPPATTPQLVQVDGPNVEVEYYFFQIDIQDSIASVRAMLLLCASKSGTTTFEWRTPKAENPEILPNPMNKNSQVLLEIPSDNQKKAMMLITYSVKLNFTKLEDTRKFRNGYRLDILKPIRNSVSPKAVLGFVSVPDDWTFSGENWSILSNDNEKLYILTNPLGIPASWEVFPNK